MNTFLIILLGLETVTLAVALIAHRRARRAARERRVEAPNSSFKSRYVEELEARERWESLDLARLHEVNREEVERLLTKVRVLGVRSLTSAERAFLERMADAHDRVVRSERKRGGPGAHPRHVPGTP